MGFGLLGMSGVRLRFIRIGLDLVIFVHCRGSAMAELWVPHGFHLGFDLVHPCSTQYQLYP